MATLNAAYDVLGDPVKRQEYDEWLLRTESAASRVTPIPVPTVTPPSPSRRGLIWWVIGVSGILGALALWFMLAFSPEGLPTDAEVRERAEGGQFELRQDSQGRIIRLNRVTGEVAVIQGNQVIPVSESSKAKARTAPRTAQSPKPEPTQADQPIAAAEPAPRARPGENVTTSTEAPIYVAPGYHPPLRVAGAGSVLRVLAVQDDWYQVEFKDPQWGTRVGYIAAALTRASSTANR